MIENMYLQIGKLDIKKLINELEFLELLDLIEILLMKSQFLENRKVIGSKRRCFFYCQKHAALQTFRLNSIQEEIDAIHLKVELLIQKLRKFHPIAIE